MVPNVFEPLKFYCCLITLQIVFNYTARQCLLLRRNFMECSINSPALSLLMKHLVIGQRPADLITSYCSYARPAQPGPIQTRLCGPCIAVIAGYVMLDREPMYTLVGWLVGWLGFNGPLRQYFSLYRAVSQREGERGEKRIDESKNVQTTPTRTYYKRSRPLPYCNPNCRTPRHWKFTQHHRTTRQPLYVYVIRSPTLCPIWFSHSYTTFAGNNKLWHDALHTEQGLH